MPSTPKTNYIFDIKNALNPAPEIFSLELIVNWRKEKNKLDLRWKSTGKLSLQWTKLDAWRLLFVTGIVKDRVFYSNSFDGSVCVSIACWLNQIDSQV